MAWANDRIRDLVTRTLLGESNGTPEGMTSVAYVMKNRGLSGAWGPPNGGLTRVITAHKQFSMWNTDDPKLRALAASVNAIPTSDPRYQRAAAIADGVFSDQIPDPTNGATHYHTPAVSPDWSQGVRPVATIGGHYFYKLPLSASNTAGTAVTGPSSVGLSTASLAPAAQPLPATAAIGPPIQSFTGGDYGRQATADAKPFQGIVIHVTGKPDLQSELKYSSTPDANRGNAYYGYHYIVDRDGKVYQTAPDDVRTNHIQGNAEHGLSNENAIGVAFVGGAPAGQNPLPMTPEQMAAGKSLVNELKAKYNIDPSKIVSHGELDPSRIKGLNPDGGAEGKDFITAYRSNPDPRPMGEGGGPTPYGVVKTSDATTPAPAPAPAPAPVQQDQGQQTASPAAANAPAAAPTPATAPSPSAGFVGPGSDKYSLVRGMTAGTSRNPQITTAANWGNLFGGSTPAAPAVQPTPDLAQRVPLDQTPTPPVRPTDPPAAAAPTVPPGAPVNAPPSSPLASIIPNWGADTPYGPRGRGVPDYGDANSVRGGGVSDFPGASRGAPSLGFPAMTNPFGQPPADQTSMLPGSMLASAQNLIRLLFPSNVG